jgi:hypothetical protein
MKKHILAHIVSVFITLLFLLSCDKSDALIESELSTAQISFTGNSIEELSCTRNTKTATLHSDEFSVFGYYTGKESIKEYLDSGKKLIANWMYDQLVTPNATGKYSYTPIKYWPTETDDKITFFAYSPTASSSSSIKVITPNINHKEGKPKFLYQTNINKPIEDFLVSHPAENLTRSSGNITFQMQHVLSRIQFNLKSSITNVKLLSIGVKNVYTQATYTTNGSKWINTKARQTLKQYDILTEEQSLLNEYKLLSNYYILIPQILEQELKPIFTLTFEDDGIKKVKEFSPSEDWTISNTYTYNISYTAGALDVHVNQQAWNVNNMEHEILPNQYLNVSTRELDLSKADNLYYNSSCPHISIAPIAKKPDGTEFNFNDFFEAIFDNTKIHIKALDKVFTEKSFTFYIQGAHLIGNSIIKLPIVAQIGEGESVDIDGTSWALGNIIYRDGKLDIADNPSYCGLYFRWGSLIGLTGNNIVNSYGVFNNVTSIKFRPEEYTDTIKLWTDVPYETGEIKNESGASKALGDPCRYMSNQAGWSKGKWRMPTNAEYEFIILSRKNRKRRGTEADWDSNNYNNANDSASVGTRSIPSGWYIKADESSTMPPDEDFNSITPPEGWIFFPASGLRGAGAGAISECSTLGYYWSSDLKISDALNSRAMGFVFSDVISETNPGSFRCESFTVLEARPIRCVRDIKTSK